MSSRNVPHFQRKRGDLRANLCTAKRRSLAQLLPPCLVLSAGKKQPIGSLLIDQAVVLDNRRKPCPADQHPQILTAIHLNFRSRKARSESADRLLINTSYFSVTSVTIALNCNSNSLHRKHKDPSEISSKLRQTSLTFSAQGPFGPLPSV